MKKSTVVCLIAALLLLSLSPLSLAFNQSEILPGSYTVPIVSLTTKAPIPSVKKAFAGAFGSSVQVEVKKDGSALMTIENKHMTINFLGKPYEANVLTMDGATVASTKTERFSNPKNGIISDAELEDETVPAVFKMPMDLSDSGAQVLTITVDFMDQFMGRGSAHPTDVTLTLDTSAFRTETTTEAPATEATTAAPTTAAATAATTAVSTTEATQAYFEEETDAPEEAENAETQTSVTEPEGFEPEITEAQTEPETMQTAAQPKPSNSKSAVNVIIGVIGLLAVLGVAVFMILGKKKGWV